nr:MAG TPA: helix-turn-helix domain protein [Caudoviricetes sp.]
MDEKTLRSEIAKLLADGATQTELAEKAGVRQNTISRYVNGLTRLRFSTALKLMELLRQENKDI